MSKTLTATVSEELIITELKEKSEKKDIFTFFAILFFAKLLTFILTIKFKTPLFAMAFFGVLYAMAPKFWKKELKTIFKRFKA